MKTCPNCHQKVAADSMFCEHCGFDLSQAPAKPQRRQRHHTSSKPGKRSKWLSRGVWCVLAVAAIAVIVLGFSFYNKQAGKEKQIATITDYITDNQSDDLAQRLVSDNPNLKITGNTVQPLLTYARSHPNYVKTMKTDLQTKGETRDHTFSLVTTGHSLLVFPIYKLRVTTMHPVLTTNVANATLMANSHALTTSKNDHYTFKAGPLFPGHYTFKLSGSRSHAKVSANLIASNDVAKHVDLIAQASRKGHDTTNANDDEATVRDATNGQVTDNTTHDDDDYDDDSDNDYDSYDDLSTNAQIAVDELNDNDYIDSEDDYTYTESEAHPDVTEVKLYDADTGDHYGTYRYDDIHDILSEYNSDSGKFETVDTDD
ncbi:TcaA second domain-containing protein [Levilactobacillus yiduensis]|uniref:TcaA second domain-containing protein n=1 Tax=Levilactobacillus yiduensis TaxID=2953880 RepID=UPI000EF2E6D1|nr:zinc ribbon domain-containing protein [Levilactobacillus yiduensis]AYM01667.1 zinc ribbon domain-containing protein [Levilactobacillus brevis]